MKLRTILLAASAVLAACAARGNPPPAALVSPPMRQAILVNQRPAPAPAVAAQAPASAANPGPRPLPRRRARRAPPGRVDAANRAALREPRADAFQNAVQVYAWAQGGVYRLYAAPGQVTDIALEAGEALTAVAAGDTARWIIGDTTSGSGASRRVHILVKPSAAGLSTNLVITTDRRSYHLQLESTARTAMAAISWTYPSGELLALGESGGSGPEPALAAGLDLSRLSFGYTIHGDRPPWRPVRAFDDGRQVFIEFPRGIGEGEAPPLFVLGADGGAELVNYRMRGNYYIVDRLFAAAELRLGGSRQQVVRIQRDEAEGRRGSRRRAR